MENEQRKMKDFDVTEEMKSKLTGARKFETFDVKKYKNLVTQIEGYSIHKSTKYTDKNGKPTYYIRVYTYSVGKYGGNDVTASKNFGLLEEDGVLFWGDDSKTQGFLNMMQVKNFDELKDIQVVTKLTEPKGAFEKRYLSFEEQ